MSEIAVDEKQAKMIKKTYELQSEFIALISSLPVNQDFHAVGRRINASIDKLRCLISAIKY